ncbi:hypothetical protein WN72_25820 [Bradyrhizobium arachidis]|uniref:Uncharacterized protein n=1 Tax=Bradyrhizobium arachidis TaxID=858423 RepID=A0AAE7NV37_9BRAD|nr:hypothetical protein WN72_25820 [Bradyrhizobium arachidis]
MNNQDLLWMSRDGVRSWRIDGSSCMRHAHRAKSIVRKTSAVLVARTVAGAAVANAGALQRIDYRDGGSPARRNWRQDLHHQREHDDGKKLFQSSTHRTTMRHRLAQGGAVVEATDNAGAQGRGL